MDLLIDSSKKGVMLGLHGSAQWFYHGDETARGENIRSLLELLTQEAGTTLSAIARVMVVTGPGSFTGLRAGIAFAQGLCFNGARQLFAVSSLAAVHHHAVQTLQLIDPLVVLYARPDHYYVGSGVLHNGFLSNEKFLHRDELLPLLSQRSIIIGDSLPEFSELMQHDFTAATAMEVFASLPTLWCKLQSNLVVGANYLQPSYAERKDERKS